MHRLPIASLLLFIVLPSTVQAADRTQRGAHLWILGGSHCPACVRMKVETAGMQRAGQVTYIDTNRPKFRYLINLHRVRLLPHLVLGVGGKYGGKSTGYMKPKDIRAWFREAVKPRKTLK